MDQHNFEPLRILFENKPIDDYFGMTYNEVHALFHDPFESSSPLKLQKEISNSVLERIPFFRLCEELINIVKREGFIKLTAKGALPSKVIHALYEKKYIMEPGIESGFYKLIREINAISILSAHYILVNSGILRKANGRLVLTARGTDLIDKGKRTDLFHLVLKGYTSKFNWAYNDNYTDLSVGQFGWGYTVYLLYRFGDIPREKQYYASVFMKAIPNITDLFSDNLYQTPYKAFSNCYITRAIERFAEWFGFAEDWSPFNRDSNRNMITRTNVLSEIFRFEL